MMRRMNRAGAQMWPIALGVAALCGAADVRGARAADFVVRSLADTDGASCEADCTLRQALRSANDLPGADVISFAVSGTIRLTRDLPYLDTEMTIRNTQSTRVIVSGDVNGNGRPDEGDVRVFGLTDRGRVVMDNLIVSGGFASANGNIGGGINNDGVLLLTNSTLAGNKSAYGGGIYSIGALTVRDCNFTCNTSITGGGISISPTGSATIENSRFSANSSDFGGGIFNEGTLMLRDSVLKGNTAFDGGGIFSQNTATISNCELSGNTASRTGGGINYSDFNRRVSGLIQIDNTRIVNNTANEGGGIRNAGVMKLDDSLLQGNKSRFEGGGIRNLNALTITRSTLRENVAATDGGGIAASDNSVEVNGTASRIGGKLIVVDSALLNNSASQSGGAIAGANSLQSGGFMQLRNSTFSGNSAVSGGGIALLSGRAAMESCTVTANRAPANRGSGIGVDGAQSEFSLSNSIVADNLRPGGTDIDIVFGDPALRNPFNSGGYNLIGSGNATANFQQSGDLVGISDAKLGPLADNGGPTLTHTLKLGSPALNGGNPAAPASADRFDQRGAEFLRVRAGRLDIGALELQLDEVPTTSVAAIDDHYNLVLGTSEQAQQAGVTLQSNGIFLIAAPGLLANDFELMAGTAKARLAKAPQNGRIQVRADGSFFYLPNSGFVGSDQFAYQLSNGLDRATATVRLKISDARAPELRFDTPRNGATLKAVTKIAGRVRDKQSGVNSVTLLWKRFDDKFWNGSVWTTNAVQLPTTVQGINWIYEGALPVPGTDFVRNLFDGSYELTATATDNSGNMTQITNRVLVKNQSAPVASPVKISSAIVSAAEDAIVITFTGNLDETSASDLNNYRATLNGVPFSIDSVRIINAVLVRITIPNVEVGDKIRLDIANLRDATDKTVAGGTLQLVAR